MASTFAFAAGIGAVLLILVEILVGRARRERIYDWRASGSHVALNMGQQVVNVLTYAAFAALYVRIFDHHRVMTFDEKNPLVWIAAFALVDLAYYAAHRAGHRVNLFAVSHLVHHQANDFNHLSSLRQSWFTRPFMVAPVLLLAVLGVTPAMIVAAYAFNHVVQFLSHNGALKRRLGPLEWIFVTPRSHRAHHGMNDPYLDKNFAGAFIFWDRLFGTYQDVIDATPVVLGPPANRAYHDPTYAQFEYLRRLLAATAKREGLLAKARLWLAPPEVLDAETGGWSAEKREGAEDALTVSRSARVAWLVALVAASFGFARAYPHLGVGASAIAIAMIFGLMLATGRAFRRELAT